jgi:Peptidyl-tRNA hydrolase
MFSSFSAHPLLLTLLLVLASLPWMLFLHASGSTFLRIQGVATMQNPRSISMEDHLLSDFTRQVCTIAPFCPFVFLTCGPNQDAAMNISGPPVSVVLRKTARVPSSLIVIHDSLEHKPTVLSQKYGGSANGHNGIRSLISALGTKEFYRLRLGIGRPESESDVASYVLARLPNFERQFWTSDGPGLDLVWEKIQKIALQVDQVSS